MMNEKLIEMGEFIHESLLNGSSKINPAFDEAMLLFVCNSLTILKEQESIIRCKDCKHFDRGRLYKCRIHGSLFQPKDENWFCADGEKDGGQMKRSKETFWDSLSEADLMEPMHHFED